MGRHDILTSRLPFWIVWCNEGEHNPNDLYTTEEEALLSARDRAVRCPTLSFYVMRAIANVRVPALSAVTTTLAEDPHPVVRT